MDSRTSGMRVALEYYMEESKHERQAELRKKAEEERDRWRVWHIGTWGVWVHGGVFFGHV